MKKKPKGASPSGRQIVVGKRAYREILQLTRSPPTAFGRINECVRAHGVQGTLVALSQHLNLEKGGPHARRLADTLDQLDQSAKEVDKEAHAEKET